MGFSRQEYWSGLPCSPPEDLPNPGIKPTSSMSPLLQQVLYPPSQLGSPLLGHYCGVECFALETNRDHSVIFEIASKYCISDLLVDYDGYSISSKGFLSTAVDNNGYLPKIYFFLFSETSIHINCFMAGQGRWGVGMRHLVPSYLKSACYGSGSWWNSLSLERPLLAD